MDINEFLFTVFGSLAGIYIIYLLFMWVVKNPGSSLIILFYAYFAAIFYFGKRA